LACDPTVVLCPANCRLLHRACQRKAGWQRDAGWMVSKLGTVCFPWL